MMFKLYLTYFFVSLALVLSADSDNSPRYIFDFTNNDGVDAWTEQSDTVRAVGMSKAVIVIEQTSNFRRAVFFALLNPQPDGSGFAGVRVQQTYNLTGYNNLQLRIRGQGEYNGFKVVLRHRGLNSASNNTYEQFFQAPVGDFDVTNLPLSNFTAYFRGRQVNNSEPLDQSQISSIGLQIYGGVFESVRQSGPATLEVDWIRATV